MKKQLRNIIISLCVVVLLVAGVVSINLFSKSSKTTSSSSSTSSTKTITVYKTDVKKITTLHIKKGGSEIMLHYKSSKYSADGILQKILNTDTASSTFSAAADVTAEKTIDKNASDLSKYGLSNPTWIVDIVSGDKTVTLDFGNETPVKDGYYLCLKGSKTVYKVATSVGSSFGLAKTDLVSESICGFDSSDAGKLTDIVLGGTARPNPIVLKVDPTSLTNTSATDSDETSSGTSTVTYNMKSPRTYPLNDENISKISSALESLSAGGIVSLDASGSNLEKYGLKNPKYNLSATYSGHKMVLDFGTPFDDGGTTMLPVYLEGTPVIYKVDESTLSFYNWQLADVSSSLIFSEYIDNVKSVTVSKGSESYTINFTGKGDELKGTYGSKKLKTDNLRKFYEKIIGITYEGAAAKPANASTYAKIVVTYHNSSRTPTTMEFLNIDARRCYWVINGKGDFYVLKSNIDNVISATKTFVAGKNLSDD